MKITKEWLEKNIARCNDNITFLKNKMSEDGECWAELYYRELGIKEGLEQVLFHKKMSNRSCVLFDKTVPMWKRHIIRTLKHFCDWLEGVEDVRIFKRDRLEKMSDEGHKRYLKQQKQNNNG